MSRLKPPIASPPLRRPATKIVPIPATAPNTALRPGAAVPFANVALPPQTGSFTMMLLASLVCMVLIGRIFEHILVGYHLPAIICALTLAFAFIRGGIDQFKNRVAVPLLFLIGWMFLCVPFSFYRRDSASVAIYFAFFALMWLPASMAPRHLRDMKRLVALLCATTLLTVFFTKLTASGRLEGESGTYSNSEDIAMIAILSIPLWLFFASQFRTIVLKVAVGGLALGFLVLTAARTGARAGLIAGAALFIFYFLRAGAAKKIGLVALLIVGLPAVIYVVPQEIRDRLSTVVEAVKGVTANREALTNEALGSARERNQLLLDSIRITFEHPLFGVGPGQFAQFRWQELHESGTRSAYLVTHNTYTEVSSEQGLPGLAFFVLMLVGVHKTLRNVKKLNTPGSHNEWRTFQSLAVSLQASFLVVVVFGLFLANPDYIFWYLMGGLALALERLSIHAIAQHKNSANQPTPRFPVPARI